MRVEPEEEEAEGGGAGGRDDFADSLLRSRDGSWAAGAQGLSSDAAFTRSTLTPAPGAPQTPKACSLPAGTRCVLQAEHNPTLKPSRAGRGVDQLREEEGE